MAELHNKLFLYAATIVGHSSAEDVVQDAYANLLEADNVRNKITYLYASVKNLAFMRLRRRKIRRGTGIKDPETLRTECDQEHVELLEHVLRAIDRLPERQQEVLMLKRVYGYSYKEISAICGISEHTIETHLGRALGTLHQKFKDELWK